MILIVILLILVLGISLIVSKGSEKPSNTAKSATGFTQKKKDTPYFKAFSQSYSFADFCNIYGPNVRMVSHINKESNETFHTLEVSDSGGKIVSVRFAHSLGELSKQEIVDRKMELFVGFRDDLKRWYLYDKNYTGMTEWENIDLLECEYGKTR